MVQVARPVVEESGPVSLRIFVPPEWFVTVSALSRKNYHQLITVQTNKKRKYSFYSKNGQQGTMSDAISGHKSVGLTTGDDGLEIDIMSFFSTSTNINWKGVANPNNISSKLNVHESLKPDNAAPEVADYATYTIFFEDTPDADQVAGSGMYDDSVAIVHIVKLNKNRIPPPPGPVIGPYNPALDRPRPSTLENYLRVFDVVFLIDDSGSMAQENRWVEAKQALNNLANWIIDHGWDSDGIELRFLNSDVIFSCRTELVNGVQDKDKIAQVMTVVQPTGGTPTGKRTREILDAHVAKLNAAKDTDAYAKIKPLDLICITDGEPTDDASTELGKMLVEAADKIRGPSPPHHPNSMGVQFVQIGSIQAARDALVKLTQLDTGCMVDTVPYAGPGSLSNDALTRILLGGMHPNIRANP